MGPFESQVENVSNETATVEEAANVLLEQEPITCPACGGPGVLLGQLGQLVHFRCRNCGITFNVKKSDFDYEESLSEVIDSFVAVGPNNVVADKGGEDEMRRIVRENGGRKKGWFLGNSINNRPGDQFDGTPMESLSENLDATGAPLSVGDVVVYSREWLRNTGQYTGDNTIDDGTIKSIRPFGSGGKSLVTVDFLFNGITKVLSSNLTRKDRMSFERR